MNLFKIVQKRTNKGKQSDNPFWDAGAVLLFVFLLPYVISCLWGHVGEETAVFSSMEEEIVYIDAEYEVKLSGAWGTRTISMEEYLIQKLALVMPQEENGIAYEMEALKAQAILLRTELWELLVDTEENVILQDDLTGHLVGETTISEATTKYEKAVHETDGVYLAYEDKPIKAAFFAVSNGQTRDAVQVWGDASYPYLKSVECGQDILAEDYQSQVRVDKEEFYRLAGEAFGIEDREQIVWGELECSYDDTGYVTKASMNGYECSGEIFRYTFGLNSACFQIDWQEDAVLFHVKGVGHGFGMSQFGANQKAMHGETFDKILKDYFFQAELVKIE